MNKLLSIAALPLALAVPAMAQEEPVPEAPAAVTPNSVIADAAAEEWRPIAAENLLVMDLAPDANGNARRIVIQLMQAPFSQRWVENIRTLARAEYWDGSSVNRVQDNYVVQWGQPDEGFGGTVKPVPEGLNVVPEECYEVQLDFEPPCENPAPRDHDAAYQAAITAIGVAEAAAAEAMTMSEAGSEAILGQPIVQHPKGNGAISMLATASSEAPEGWHERDPYAEWVEFHEGWPLAAREIGKDEFDAPLWSFWPTHCYGMVGVGRNLSPDTGDGSQLYTVIGHAPRHLDRNIALVGRVIDGMEHLTSLPRGTGPLGFYESEEELVPIRSARIASDMNEPPTYEYLNTGSASFERYVAVRANRQDDFYNIPAGGVDICNVPVPIRRTAE
mgnify:CR=1 FL=1